MRWRESLGMVMEELERLAPNHPTPIEVRARTILALINGLATQMIFNPREWTANQARRSLREALDGISSDGKSGSGRGYRSDKV